MVMALCSTLFWCWVCDVSAVRAEPPASVAHANAEVSAAAWLAEHGDGLEPCARAFVVLLGEEAARAGRPLPMLEGRRSVASQAAAIYANWRRAKRRGGTRGAYRWARGLYQRDYAKQMHAIFVAIEGGRATVDEWEHAFAAHVRDAGIPSHTNGLAIDVTPRRPWVYKLLKRALARGVDAGVLVPYRRGVVREGNHYHVQLIPPSWRR